MPLPTEGQMSWAEALNTYLLGAAVEAQADLAAGVAGAGVALTELIAITGGTTGLLLDTDGVPAYDPTGHPGPSALAMVLDTDGVPAYVTGA